MSSEEMPAIGWVGESRCWTCGRMVKHRPQGGPQPRHWCSLRWLSRRAWKAYREGWHEGYRFGIENWTEPLVQADVDDYGTGWAGHMRVGHVTVGIGGEGGAQ